MAYTTIDKPTDYFETLTWSGDNASPRNITGLDFTPDFVWIKEQNIAYSTGHRLYDSVRGVGANKELDTSSTQYEGQGNIETYGYPNALISGGYTVQTGTTDIDYVNKTGNTYVSWNWKAGTSFSNDASATGIGTIDSTGSVSTTAGLSIISYTGNGTTNQSVAHGLGATPKVIIIKNRTSSSYWCFTGPRFFSTSDTNMLYMQNTAAEADDTNVNGNTAPSSTVFGIGDYSAVNTSGNAHIAYCFTEIKGYSKFGYFQGNGNSNGPFVYLGFKPAWILFKNTTGNNWGILNNKQDPFNITQTRLHPNLDIANNTGAGGVVDFLSNGFKCRNSDGLENGAAPIVYMAFAENPFVTSTGIPATAR